MSVAEGQGGSCAVGEEAACAQGRGSILLTLQLRARRMGWMRDGDV